MNFETLVTPIATLALAVITFFYMRHTRKMANLMAEQTDAIKKQTEFLQREYELKMTPRLDPSIFVRSVSGSEVELELRIVNNGLYPIQVNGVEFHFKHRELQDISHVELYTINYSISPGGGFHRPDIRFDYRNFEEFQEYPEISNMHNKGWVGAIFIFQYGSDVIRYPLEGSTSEYYFSEF